MEEKHTDISIKIESEDLQVEFGCAPISLATISDKRKFITSRISSLDERTTGLQKRIEEYNVEIERLTDHSDNVDLFVAVSCGVMAGLLDAFWVGEFDFKGSREKVDKKFEEIVKNKANNLREKEVKQKTDEAIEKARQTAKAKGKSLSSEEISKIRAKFNKKLQEPLNKEKSIKFLEERFSIPSDSVYEKANRSINEQIRKIVEEAEKNGTPLSNDEIKSLKRTMKTRISHDSHHLDDLTHHPSILGLTASIAQQFGAKAVFQNREGKTIPIAVETVKTPKRGKEVIEIRLVGEDIRSKLVCGTINWIMHLISDMAGSSAAARKGTTGMGLPGPILSILKEASMIPGLNNTSLPKKLYELFTEEQEFLNGYTLDFRSELAIGVELGKQAIPVFINTVIVRCFYFLRHLIQGIKENGGFNGLDKKALIRKSIPFRNRSVSKMISVATGTFMMIDLVDAAIETAVKKPEACKSAPTFFATMMLRVNFVGIGRFAIAIRSDVGMGINKAKNESERAILLENLITTCEARLFYNTANTQIVLAELYSSEKSMHDVEAGMWKQVKRTDNGYKELYEVVSRVGDYYSEIIKGLNESFDAIEDDVDAIKKSDPDFIQEMLKRLE